MAVTLAITAWAAKRSRSLLEFNSAGSIIKGWQNGLSVTLTVLGPSVWVQTLGFAQSVFPFEPPTIVALPLAFVLCIAVSLLQSHHLQVRALNFDG